MGEEQRRVTPEADGDRLNGCTGEIGSGAEVERARATRLVRCCVQRLLERAPRFSELTAGDSVAP